MTNKRTHCIRFFLLLGSLIPATAAAWTSARLSSVEATLDVASEGVSRVQTRAVFDVTGGRFHGFDLAPVEAGSLVKEECAAFLDDGRRYPLNFRSLFDGRTRVVLADRASVGRGSIRFHLVHQIDLAQTGAIRSYGGRARLDWTPIIWDHGTDQMTVTINLPGKSEDAGLVPDTTVTDDYETVSGDQSITFVKHRTVRWYPMQVVVDFDPRLVSLDHVSPSETNAAASRGIPVNTRKVGPAATSMPFHVATLPLLVVLLGLILMMLKAWRIRRAHDDLGIATRYRLLPRTGSGVRFALSGMAAGLGFWAQGAGFLAASVPPMAVSAALWLIHQESGSVRCRPGGAWRRMSDEDLSRMRILARRYTSRRRSWLDMGTPLGIILFLVAVSLSVWACLYTRELWPRVTFAICLNSVMWILPIWFSLNHTELPVDATIESFRVLGRWKDGLSRLVGAVDPQASATFWVREDERGAAEVRLRVEPPPSGLTGLEIAGEVVSSGAVHKIRRAAILRMEPGTPGARKLAACPNAVEHHLTPDLEEEIIVLRNRRGQKDAGLGPLRSALISIRA